MLNLMIIAHPDDELFFGWKELQEKKWLVICLTNGKNKMRYDKFKKVINLFQQKFLISSFKDNWKKLSWDYNIQNSISLLLEKILINNQFGIILTHNPEGEYGHYHHKIISKIVKNLLIKLNIIEKLYYFNFDNIYYTELSNLYIKCVKIYFENYENIESVKSHIKLSKISSIIHYKNYKNNYEFIKTFYSNDFLKTNIIKYNKYLL